MSALLNLDNISVQIGNRDLFRDLKLIVPKRDKLGIVGPNGSGKSTLLKVMAGIIQPESGRVIKDDLTRISYVPQIAEFNTNQSVIEVALQKVGEKFDESEAYVSASKALTQAGFEDFDKKVEQLSGGWKKRLALAAALAEKPELLLLDEPTNHLDMEGLLWLEELLQKVNFAWVLVSHDRYFLERTVQRIVEIAPIYVNGYFESAGSYLTFKENRAAFLEQESKRTSSLANLAKRELEWASRAPKARTGKASFRMKAAQQLKSDLKAAKSRQESQVAVTTFQSTDRGSKELVKLIKCNFSFGENTIIRDLSFIVRNQMCLGLLGANGQGKSTLLKLIGGSLEPDSGKVKHVHGLKCVYFDQLRESLREWKTLGELLGGGYDQVEYRGKSLHIIGWGKRFGFEPEDHDKPVGNLSGGEQARALLSILVRQQADLLLLDEPTNDLDIPMLEMLEIMILEFDGAVVLITHDRFMLDEVCTHFLGFTSNGELQPFASFEQWSGIQDNDQTKTEAPPTTESKKKQALKKLSFKEQREYDTIEGIILKAEEELAEAETLVANPDVHSNKDDSQAATQKLLAAKQRVEELYKRWEELDSIKRARESSSPR